MVAFVRRPDRCPTSYVADPLPSIGDWPPPGVILKRTPLTFTRLAR